MDAHEVRPALRNGLEDGELMSASHALQVVRRHGRARCSSAALAMIAAIDFRDPSQPVPARVAALLSQMTLAEKVAQLAAFNGNAPAGAAGSASVGKHTIAGRNAMQANAMNASRFGIPLAWFQEALHGGCAGATIFPMPLTMGASMNVTLVERMYAVIGRATRACGANIAFAPVINLWTDPRFGRFQEGFRPSRASRTMASPRWSVCKAAPTASSTYYRRRRTVVALGKHLAGYGGAMGGLNGGPLVAGEREIRDVYLKPWRAFAAAGGRGAMPSHQTVLDVPAHASSWLINDVFRDEYGFGDGLTISDCNDVNVLMQFRVAANVSHAAAKGIAAGVDQDLQCGHATYTLESVEAALAAGLLDEKAIDAATRHVLTAKVPRLFEGPSMRASRPTP